MTITLNKPPIGIDGGNICAACGSCCKNCGNSYGYFFSFYLPKIVQQREGNSLSENIILVFKNLFQNSNSKYFGDNNAMFKAEDINALLIILKKEWSNAVEFSKEKGFLGINGCTIPRQFRSKTCVNYICDKLKDNIVS